MTGMRHVIIHYHIFKNAGSTVDAILKKNFPLGWGTVEGKPMTYKLSNEELLSYILENPKLKAVSSHEARPPAPNESNLVFFPILFIRHPIDRIGSIYAYRRSLPKATTRSTEIAHEMDMAGYIKWCLLHPSSETISNFQTTFLSKHADGLYGQPDLEVAIKRVRELPFVGLVEFFDKSLLQLQGYLSEAFGGLDLSYTVTNKSIGRMSTIQERLKNIETSLGSSLYQELLEYNAMDLELYDVVTEIFQKKFTCDE